MKKLSTDKKLKLGHLSNGLTYYIRHNEYPKGQASFYLIRNVGSIQENDNQRGLAHFLEHMSFDGTESFPGDSLISYCESLGIKFGVDLNAYTSAEETVYQIKNVPLSTSQDIIDKILLILYDWTINLTLDTKAIEREKKVILEEFRTTSNPIYRMQKRMLPKLYPNSKYGYRNVIGLQQTIKGIKRDMLLDFYRTWYRPDLTAIIAVGDFNANVVEEKIKSLFAGIKVPQKTRRVSPKIKNDVRPIVVVARDNEQKFSRINICKKIDSPSKKHSETQEYLCYLYKIDLILWMLSYRLEEKANTSCVNFTSTYPSYTDYYISKNKKSFGCFFDIPNDKDVIRGIREVYEEFLRVSKYGFTQEEFDMSKNIVAGYVENAYNEKEAKDNSSFCDEYVTNYTRNEPAPGIETEYSLMLEMFPEITLQEINLLASKLCISSFDSNTVIVCYLRSGEKVSGSSIRRMLAKFDGTTLKPYMGTSLNKSIVSNVNPSGSIEVVSNSVNGYKKFKLSNGVNVFFKKTDSSKDEVLLYATADGGKYVYPSSKFYEFSSAEELSLIAGLGEWNKIDLQKKLQGTRVDVKPQINALSDNIKCQSSVKELEKMFEVLYLLFTSIKKDNDAFFAWKNKKKAELQYYESDDFYNLNELIDSMTYQEPKYYNKLKSTDIDNIDYDEALEIAYSIFSNPARFSFIITGNVEEKIVTDHIERYLSSLKVNNSDMAVPQNHRYSLGKSVRQISRIMETPSSYSMMLFFAPIDFSLKNVILNEIVSHIISILLINNIRMENGDVYMIDTFGYVSRIRPYMSHLYIMYQTHPEQGKIIDDKILGTLHDLSVKGPSQGNLTKAKDYLLKKHQENLDTNLYFQDSFNYYLRTGVDEISCFIPTLREISVEDVKSHISMLIKANNYKQASLTSQ